MNVLTVPVGDFPVDIALTPTKVYVVNAGPKSDRRNDSVSVISGTNYTKIKDVPVGDNPVDLDSTGYTVHVANSGSDTISAINSANYTKIKDVPVEPGLGHTPVHLITQHGTGLLVLDATANASLFTHDGSLERLGDIPVGRLPLDAAAEDEWNGAVYVANYMSGTVSAIDFDKKKVSEIPVGVNPKPIAINQDKRIVYVANVGNLTASDISTKNGTVSAIYIPTNKVVSGVAFNIVPFHGGHVKCNTEFPNNQFYNVEAPTNQYFYTGFGTNCIAEPSKGFQFPPLC